MNNEELKKVVAEVSEDVLISLKILALKKRVPLGVYIKEILDKHVAGKVKQVEIAEQV
jgi:hypothetical protein